MMDKFFPRDGNKPRLQQYQLGDYLPLWRVASYLRQAISGQPMANMGKGFLTAGDEWEAGRIGKQIALSAIRGEISPELALWGIDIAKQIVDNVGPLPEQPDEARKVFEAGVAASGKNRFLATAGAYFLGLSIYDYPPEEAQMHALMRQRFGLGYSPERPYGSRAAIEQFDEETGEILEPGFSYRQLYPSTSEETSLRPGVAAAKRERRAEQAPIYAAMGQAADQAIMADPIIRPSALADVKAPYYDQAAKVAEKYPSAELGGVPTRPPVGMTPPERAKWEVERLITTSEPPDKPVYPGENADAKTLRAYYQELGQWRMAWYDNIEKNFSQLASSPDLASYRSDLEALVEGQYASELVRRYDTLRFATPLERQWSEFASVREEMESAEWRTRENEVRRVMGDQVLETWRAYQETEKGSPEREQFRKEHPEVLEANIVAYNRQEYHETLKKFGEDAWDIYFAERPAWPGDDATEAQKQAYYKELDQFHLENPTSPEIRMWVDGRYRPGKVERDFGKDHAEAKEIFGENIFELEREFNETANKRDWYRQATEKEIMRLEGYRAWKSELAEMPELPPPAEKEIFTPEEVRAYQGERPVGSGRQPILQRPTAGPTPGPTAGPTPGPTASPMPRSTYWEQLGIDALFTPGSTASPTPGAATPETAGPEPTTAKTAQEYALERESYRTRLEIQKRIASIHEQFGGEIGSLYEQYLNLPAGEARAKFKDSNPAVRAAIMFSYHPEEYARAQELFGQDIWLTWANSPRGDSEEANTARGEYYDVNPNVKLLNAWLYGRRTREEEIRRIVRAVVGTDAEDEFEYDFGADYDEARRRFGDNIWDIYRDYRPGWNRGTKRDYFNKFPQLSDFFSWWFEDSGSSSAGAEASYRPPIVFGGGRGGGGYRVPRPEIEPNIYQIKMRPPVPGQQRWRPETTNWLNAGAALRWRD
jgi:hypothetical protein